MRQTGIFPIVLLTVLFLGISFNGSAQNEHNHSHNHYHDEHIFHVGVGAGFASFSGEEGLEPSLHLHLLRKLNAGSKWSLGVGYEGIKGEQWHNGLNLLVNYRPLHFISFNAGPGVVFEEHDGEKETLPAFHAESVVEFTIADLHFGPMVGFGINKEHTHFSVGIHLGFGI
jgi:hypothetical protein